MDQEFYSLLGFGIGLVLAGCFGGGGIIGGQKSLSKVGRIASSFPRLSWISIQESNADVMLGYFV